MSGFALSLLAVRASVVLLLAAAAVAVLRRASASARHAALLLAVASLLALPLLSALLPRWDLPVLSAPAPPAVRAPAATAPASVPPGRSPVRSPRTRPPAAAASLGEPQAASPLAAEREPAAPRAPQPVLPAWPLSTWLLAAWAAGVAAGVVQLLAAALLVRRTARGASPVSDADWSQPLADAAAHLGLTRPVRLLSSPAAVVPVVYGYPDAVVLLPPGASAWPEDRRRALLVHELAHVGRRDFLSQTLAHVARLLYWPHPLVWWLVRRLRAEAERACDDIVLSAGTAASDYASMLLDAARDLRRARRPLAMLAVVERSRLEERLLALLEPAARRGRVGRRSLLLATSAGLALAVAAATLQPVARAIAAGARPVPAAARDSTPPTLPRPATAAKDPAPAVPASPAPTAMPVASATIAPEARTTGAEEPSVADEPEAPEPVPVMEPVAGAPAAALAPPAPAPAAAATPSPASVPVIRISTEIVQLDAVVTDKAGRPVVDLRPEDFEVFESGRRQKVSHLVYVKTGKGPTTGGAAAVAAAPQTAEPRTMVMVVDDYGLSLESSVRTRELLTGFVERDLADTDRAAIVRTSEVGTRPLSLTSERSALAADAAAIRYNTWARRGFTSRDPGGFPVWDPSRSDWVWRDRIDSVWRESLFAIDSLRAVKSTVDALRALPGRKAVIFLSEGFPTVISQDSSRLVHQFTMRPVDGLYDDTGVRAAMQSLIDLANRAAVVIYALDPSGLTTDQINAEDGSAASGSSLPGGPYGPDSSAPIPAPSLARQRTLERHAREDSLLELADETGGLAVFSGNDLTQQLGRILADHAGYYLIGYEPASETFAKVSGAVPFHKVKIEVKRRGLKVRSRKGFYGVPDEVLAQAAPPP